MDPTPPRQVLTFLIGLFPAFENSWKTEQVPPEDGLVDGVYEVLTHHRGMAEFLVFFSKNRASFTESQLERLGEWINDAVASDGDLENAVSTCFLEHSRQVRIDRVLAPYLSKQAKAKSRA